MTASRVLFLKLTLALELYYLFTVFRTSLARAKCFSFILVSPRGTPDWKQTSHTMSLKCVIS